MKTYNPYKLFRFCPIPNWLMQRQEVSYGAKCLFGQLTQHAGEDGFCFPSQKTLAKELGCSERYIRKLVAELKRHKLIATVRDNTHQSNSYVFLVHPWMSCTTEEKRQVVEEEEPQELPQELPQEHMYLSDRNKCSSIKDPIKQQTERRQRNSSSILEEMKQWEKETVSFEGLRPEIKETINQVLSKLSVEFPYLNGIPRKITENVDNPTLRAKALAKHYLDRAEKQGLWKRGEVTQDTREGG